MLTRLPSRVLRAVQHSRTLATHVPTPSLPAQAGKDGALRPHLNIPVNPNHGLYAFFRQKVKDGEVSYDTVEPADVVRDKSGRAWTAPELRRKSFKDLHTLWYVLVRERNLLATQQAEARRMGANEQTLGVWAKSFRCRKSMARIKYVINERRLAYEGAVRIHEELRENLQGKEEEAQRKAIEAQEQTAVAEQRKAEKAKRRQESPAGLAAASLFESVPQSQKSA